MQENHDRYITLKRKYNAYTAMSLEMQCHNDAKDILVAMAKVPSVTLMRDIKCKIGVLKTRTIYMNIKYVAWQTLYAQQIAKPQSMETTIAMHYTRRAIAGARVINGLATNVTASSCTSALAATCKKWEIMINFTLKNAHMLEYIPNALPPTMSRSHKRKISI
jgi:hypothetical protein